MFATPNTLNDSLILKLAKHNHSTILEIPLLSNKCIMLLKVTREMLWLRCVTIHGQKLTKIQ